MSDLRTKIRITSDPTKAVCSKNGKNYDFAPPLTPGQVVDIARSPSTVKDLVNQGVAEKVKK